MKYIINTKFRFYQNEEITALGNLKVGSRFLDNYFQVENHENEIHYTDEGNFIDIKSYREGMFQQKFQPIYNLLENKDSRKVFLIYRNPIMRIQSAFSMFFLEWLKQSLNIELVPLSVASREYLLHHYWGTDDLGNHTKMPHEVLSELFPYMERFVNYFATKKIDDQHVTNYLHIWNELANKIKIKNADKLNLINIDEQRLEKVFNTDSPKKGGQIINFKSDPLIKEHFKDMILNNKIIINIISSEVFHFNNLEKIRNG